MNQSKEVPKLMDAGRTWLCMVLGCALLAGCKQPEQSKAELPAPPDQPVTRTFDGTPAPGRPEGSLWKVGKPMVWYMQGPGAGGQNSMWGDGHKKIRPPDAGPPRFEFISPAVAKKLAAGGFNMMFCRNLDDFDSAQANGMRGMLYVHEGKAPWRNVFHKDALDDPEWLAKLDVLIDKVKDHPAMYGYISVDEPGASEFPGLGRLVDYVRKRDPKHVFYINLFPMYASAGAQETSGDKVTAYREYLRRFIEEVKPDLISYDHYQMKYTSRAFDGSEYFHNLALVREATVKYGLPFMNVIQASSMGLGWRQPNPDEGRYLAFTTLAYGGQGICQFVYNAWEGAEHWGGVEYPDRTPTALGNALRQIHPEFVAVGEQVQPLISLGAYHLGTVPEGGMGLPADAAFTVDPPVAPNKAKGILLGYFGTAAGATHVLVVNLNYFIGITTTVTGPGPMAVFDAKEYEWHPAPEGARATVSIVPGGGKLLRLQ
jgi:hypothetical protein